MSKYYWQLHIGDQRNDDHFSVNSLKIILDWKKKRKEGKKFCVISHVIFLCAVFYYVILYSRAISVPVCDVHTCTCTRTFIPVRGKKVRSTSWDELWSRFFIQWVATWVASQRETCRGVNRSAFRQESMTFAPRPPKNYYGDNRKIYQFRKAEKYDRYFAVCKAIASFAKRNIGFYNPCKLASAV